MTRALLASPITLALTLAACAPPSSSQTVTCNHTPLASPLLVLERGTETAAMARYEGGCLTETKPDPVLGQDQQLLAAHATGKPFVAVNDDGSLRAVDAETLTFTRSYDVYQDVKTPSSIPHGIYGVDTDATGALWVSRDDLSSLAVLLSSGVLDTTVDLGSLDPDGDGHPDMNGILVTGGRAYVALGFLTHGPNGSIAGDTARYSGMIAIVDTAAPHAVLGKIDLPGHNPVRAFVPAGDDHTFLLAVPGKHDEIDDDDGVDLVDLASGTAKQVISETLLKGSVDEVVWAGPNEAYAIVLNDTPGINATRLVAFDPGAGKVTRELARAPWYDDPVNGQAYVFTGLALDGDEVVVGDHTQGSPKIRVFSRATGAEATPIVPQVEAPWALVTLP